MSTFEAPARTYHHGDLRSALVAAGLKALETNDVTDLSLRQIAREVGVSATAVYRHFPHKQALLDALAEEGIARLGEAQQAATRSAGKNVSAFAASGRAYVRFALAHPALFRLAFNRAAVGDSIFGATLSARLLQQQASDAVGGVPEATRRLMIQSWSVVHGLAMLMLDGQLPAEDALIDQVIDPDTLFPRTN